jgi:hypothetical protein
MNWHRKGFGIFNDDIGVWENVVLPGSNSLPPPLLSPKRALLNQNTKHLDTSSFATTPLPTHTSFSRHPTSHDPQLLNDVQVHHPPPSHAPFN